MLKWFTIFIICIGLVALAGLGGAWWLLQTPLQPSASAKEIIIPKGSGVMSIATVLSSEGIIRHPWLFRLAVIYQGTASKLQAGSFEVSAGQSPLELAVVLTKGTQDVWVTIPEGLRVEEIAELLSAQLGSFDADEYIELARESEGFLFPETYLVPKTITPQAFYDLQIATFDKKVEIELQELFKAQSRSQKDILIMASLVQREARDPEQMRHVAGILWNRIEIGMPLQVDATLQYVKGVDARGEWWSIPLAADKQLVSGYNTYLNAGLPPGPISNPGQDAIRATLDPLESDDLFYLHAPDGSMHYARDLDGHNQNIAKYLRN